MRGLVAELRERLNAAAGGGGKAARSRHIARCKMLARDRVDLLIDPGTAFLELSPLAANGLYGGDVHSASVITGIGQIAGRECVVVANDATIKGGTYYPLTVKKHLRAQDIARENNLPCVYMVDSGGAFLPADGIGRRAVQARLDLHTRASLTISWPAMLSARARVCARERLGEGSNIIFYDRQV
jgi:3-methylcrotonyl-CoA carboxylase beta subunit